MTMQEKHRDIAVKARSEKEAVKKVKDQLGEEGEQLVTLVLDRYHYGEELTTYTFHAVVTA